ncbi:unnamed protein product [Rotaria sp. Silwood1]|nr:unnamed protein product [Rotaria sp. Silwood1]CAF3474202.1 unnamed protein product [Rotaria sp. Silwood1]CAF4730650.1 unnamed protein product [Rotaria sp. Silwood1]CAF4973392.1 unnamed protein product [Rotaria sp. Silwood1]
MVDISTQTVSNTEGNSRDLLTLTNDAFLAALMNKTKIEHEDFQSQYRDIIDSDPAVLVIGRSLHNQRSTDNHNHCDSFNKKYDDRPSKPSCQCRICSNDQQQINIVDQLINQPHIPYALLPKHFKPKQISNDCTQHSQLQNYLKENNQWYKSMIYRHRIPTHYYYKRYNKHDYTLYPYRSSQIRSRIPLNILSSYNINQWQDPYVSSDHSLFFQQQQHDRIRRYDYRCIRDDHRIKASI